MSKFKRDEFRDINIINALKKLPNFIINNDGNSICIRSRANGHETGIEHIVKRYHGLSVKDINNITNTLKSPFKVCINDNFCKKSYYSKIYKKYKFSCFLKIVTELRKDGSEQIVTIFRTNKIK